MKRGIQAIAWGAVAGVWLFWASGCIMVAQEPVEPQAGLYNYEYYPDAEVYYDPAQRTYFWLEASVWCTGPVLPARIQLVGRPVVVQLRSNRPYLYHATVRSRHPPVVVVRGRARF